MAPVVLLALVEAGVVLWAEGDRLRFRAPEGALTDELRGRVGPCRGALLVLVKAGAVLPVSRADWPAETVENCEERAGVMQFDGGLRRADAEVAAERRVRVEYARRFIERGALVGAP